DDEVAGFRKADRGRELRGLPAVVRAGCGVEPVDAAADDIHPVEPLLVKRPEGALTDDVPAIEEQPCRHWAMSWSTGPCLTMSVSRRCQATSRHMPRYCGPQKLDEQIAVQRPVAELCSTPAAQT